MPPTLSLDGQASVRELLMGQGTPYRLLGFSPWSRNIRSDQAEHAFQHGAWSGREFLEAATVPFRVRVEGDSAASWLALHQQLTAAFAPADGDVELRWRLGGVEYLMRGRPRVVDPEIRLLGVGRVNTACAFVALDPRIYSAVEHLETLGLPSVVGGLALPATVPVTLGATVTSGRVQVANAGTVETGLLLRIDGPVQEPRVTLTTPDGPLTLRAHMTVESGQWLDIDTARRTARLNGTVSRRGLMSGDWPLLPPGSSELAFDAAVFDASALLTARWRDTWL